MNPAKIDYAKYFFDRTLIRMAVRLSIILVFLLGVFAGLNYVFKTADEKIYNTFVLYAFKSFYYGAKVKNHNY
jgi:hypothetical protein